MASVVTDDKMEVDPTKVTIKRKFKRLTEYELTKALKLFAEFKVTFLEDGDKQKIWNETTTTWDDEVNNGVVVKRKINRGKGVIKEVTHEFSNGNKIFPLEYYINTRGDFTPHKKDGNVDWENRWKNFCNLLYASSNTEQIKEDKKTIQLLEKENNFNTSIDEFINSSELKKRKSIIKKLMMEDKQWESTTTLADFEIENTIYLDKDFETLKLNVMDNFIGLLSWPQMTDWFAEEKIKKMFRTAHGKVEELKKDDGKNKVVENTLLDFLLELEEKDQEKVLNGVVHVTNFKDNRGGVPLFLKKIAFRQRKYTAPSADNNKRRPSMGVDAKYKSIFVKREEGDEYYDDKDEKFKLQDNLAEEIIVKVDDIFNPSKASTEVEVDQNYINNAMTGTGVHSLDNGIQEFGIWVQISLPSVPHLVTAIIRNGEIYTFGGSYGNPSIDKRGVGIPYEFGDMYLMSPDELIQGTGEDAKNKQQIVAWGIYNTDIKYRLIKLLQKVNSTGGVTMEGMYKVGGDSYSALTNRVLKKYFNWSNCVAVGREVIQGEEPWGDSTISHFISLPWDSVHTFDIDLLYEIGERLSILPAVTKRKRHENFGMGQGRDGGGKKKKTKKKRRRKTKKKRNGKKKSKKTKIKRKVRKKKKTKRRKK